MARKPPPEGKRFQKGQVANPGGRRKLPDDIKEARKVTQDELERSINRAVFSTRAELAALVKDPGTRMLDVMVASIVAQASQKGDQQRLDFLLNRMIGKVKDRIEVKPQEPFIITRASGEQVVLGLRESPPSEE